MFDNHIHSNFSGDSEMQADAGCEAALKLGLYGIAFTDHLDYDYPDFDDKFLIDFKKYSDFMDALKQQYKGRLKVLKGIEAGIQPHVIHPTNEIINKYDFDFVIASIHIIDNLDPYSGTFFKGKSKHEAYIRYLNEILFSVTNFDNFDIVGHIGYIRRYGTCYDDNTLSYADYCDVLDTILKTVIAKGKGIEINTSGYKSLGTPIPDFDIIRRYKELGGEIICMGSDAHAPEHIGFKFELVRESLLDIGFRYAAHFEERKPVFDKL